MNIKIKNTFLYMKVFIIHYKKLLDRKIFILQQLQKHNIKDYEFIEIDRDELFNENIEIFHKDQVNSDMAITLSHFYAFKQISEKYENALILEDDVILSDNFSDILSKYIMQLPQDYDMLFIGDGCGFHIQKDKLVPNQYIYEKCQQPTSWGGNGITRCTDSYVVNKKCAIQLCKYINKLPYKINYSIDWWLNIAGRDNNLKVYWAEPTICTQGTAIGLYKSSH